MTEYDSYSSYERNVLRQKTSQSSFSFSIQKLNLFEIGYSQNDNRFKKFIQRMKSFSSTVSTAPLNSLLTRFLYLCLCRFHPHRQVSSHDEDEQNLSPWLDFAVCTGQVFIKLQHLGLCLQHPGAFLFTELPGTRLPTFKISHNLVQSVQSTAEYPHLGVWGEITCKKWN